MENPIRAIRDISHDITCRRTILLASGREVSALDIQREYLNAALQYAQTKGFTDLEQRALEMWEHCVTKIEDDPMKLDREVDWVIKHKLLDAYCAKNGLDLGDPKAQLVDLQYHDILRTRGLFNKLQERNMHAVEPILTKVEYSLIFESPTMTCRRR